MSQEKVNLRKEYKKNRKEILAKEKRQQKMNAFIGYLLVIVIVAGIGFSVYKKFTPEKAQDANAFFNLIQTDEYGFLNPVLPEE